MFSPVEAIMTAEARNRERSENAEYRALLLTNETGASAPVRLERRRDLFSWLAAEIRELSARLTGPTPERA